MIKQETQNVEFKESWRDEYLKWICGFANAQGGELYIGVRDDGSVCGVEDAKRLMEEIPNKTIALLGVVVDVDLLAMEAHDVVRVRVNAYSVPISFRGVYHYRSGATKQELTGTALQDFLFRKTGLSWDDVACVGARIEDIDERAVRYFLRHSIESGRMPEDAADLSTRELLEGLGLLTDHGQLKNAAVLLFGRCPQRKFPNEQFKIGRFGADETDLLFQDQIEGNILQMADRVVEVLRSKYMISPVSYRGLTRVEKLEVPEDALREAIFNAIVHRNYAGAHTQMKIWNDRIELWNDGALPMGLTVDRLAQPHSSHPRNRNIANVFYRAGFIEAWGRGISKITKGFETAGLGKPIFSESCGGMMIVLKRNLGESLGKDLGKEFGKELGKELPEKFVNLYNLLGQNPTITQREIAKQFKISEESVRIHIKGLVQGGFVRRVGGRKTGHWEIVKAATIVQPSGESIQPQEGESIQPRTGETLQPQAETLQVRVETLQPSAETLQARLEALRGNSDIADILKRVKKHNRREDLNAIIVGLCAVEPLQQIEVARLLGLNEQYLRPILYKLVSPKGPLYYTIPDMIHHPRQAYTAHRPEPKTEGLGEGND